MGGGLDPQLSTRVLGRTHAVSRHNSHDSRLSESESGSSTSQISAEFEGLVGPDKWKDAIERLLYRDRSLRVLEERPAGACKHSPPGRQLFAKSYSPGK